MAKKKSHMGIRKKGGSDSPRMESSEDHRRACPEGREEETQGNCFVAEVGSEGFTTCTLHQRQSRKARVFRGIG